MRGKPYTVDYFKAEEERLEQLLLQSLTAQDRAQYAKELETARAYLADAK